MKIICREKNTNKTKELIKESLDKNIPILAMTQRKSESLKEKSLAYFDTPVRIITASELREYDGDILIDDLDGILEDLVRVVFDNRKLNVAGVTWSV